MPAGELLINQVAGLLLPTTGKRMPEIIAGVTLQASPRAVRYAVAALVQTGRAIRKGHVLFAAKLQVNILKSADGIAVEGAVPLAECFPDDPDGYAVAVADLMRIGEHRGGGGAAPEYHLKLAEVA